MSAPASWTAAADEFEDRLDFYRERLAIVGESCRHAHAIVFARACELWGQEAAERVRRRLAVDEATKTSVTTTKRGGPT